MASGPPSGLLMAGGLALVAGERQPWEDFAMVLLSGTAKEFTECDAVTET